MAELIRRCRPLLGTFVEVTVDREDAVEVAFAAIGQVHRLMSAHEAESDVSRINRFAHLRPVKVDALTAQVLERAIFWSRQSAGAFDVVRAGKAAIASGYLPSHSDQPAPQANAWTELQVSGDEVRLARPGCIDLGGIAKGFAVDQAIAAMRSAGASRGLVNAGGDLAGFGPEPWAVTIADSRTRLGLAQIELFETGLATSSVLDDGRSDHLPGRDAERISASVTAPMAMDADALTKILLSGSPAAEQCLAVVDADALMVGAAAVEQLAA